MPDSPQSESSQAQTESNGAPQAELREEFVRMLRCPESRQQLRLADKALLSKLNAAIAQGNVVTKGGEKLAEPADAALVREDNQVVYTVNGRIPRLTKDEGVTVSQFQASNS